MTSFTFTTNTEKKYKQAYKQHIDKLYPIYQSKKVNINGDSYVLVGQKRMEENQLFSDFDVFNGDGESADEDVGYRIHEWIARLIITKEMICKISEPVARLMDEDIDSQFLKERFLLKDEDHINQLTQSLARIHEHMDSLIDLVRNLSKKEYFDETNINELADKWSAFIKTYETRAYTLLTLYDQQSSEAEEVSFENDRAALLRKEAKEVYAMYEIATPQGAEIGSVSINEWIVHNYEYGRFRKHDEPEKKQHRFERGLYSFVVYLYRFAVWFFIPLIIIALLMDGELTFGAALPLVSFSLIGSMVKSQNKTHLLKKINNDIVNHRAVSHEDGVSVKGK